MDPEELYNNVKKGISSIWKKTVKTVDKWEEKCNNVLNKNQRNKTIENYTINPNPEQLGSNIESFVGGGFID